MTVEHEYSIIGHRRWKAAFYLSVLSGMIAGFSTYALKMLLIELTKHGIAEVPSIFVWPITGAMVFGGLYFLFDRYIWRFSCISYFIGIPNISGTWLVTGQTFDLDGERTHKWKAVMTISQLYEKITIRLKTSQSSSRSISATLIPEAGTGFRLIYSYQNEPRVGEIELNRHIGHCELTFDSKTESASGDYFNGGGRNTFGHMELRKEKNGEIG